MRTAIQQLSYILILLTIFSSCNKDNEKEIIEESYGISKWNIPNGQSHIRMKVLKYIYTSIAKWKISQL